MPQQTTTFRLLLISPGDVAEEREVVIAVIERWNATIGISLSAHVVTRRWEVARPEMGAPPQDVINEQIVDDADFGVAIFWARLGSPTEHHPSGSAEEVARLVARGAKVMVYFSAKPVPHALLKDDQYDKLQVLRATYEKAGLLATFEDAGQLAGNGQGARVGPRDRVPQERAGEQPCRARGRRCSRVSREHEDRQPDVEAIRPRGSASGVQARARGVGCGEHDSEAACPPLHAGGGPIRDDVRGPPARDDPRARRLAVQVLNAENKPAKAHDQQAIDAIKAQIADVQQRFKTFQEEAAKVAKENFPTGDT